MACLGDIRDSIHLESLLLAFETDQTQNRSGAELPLEQETMY